MPHGLVHESEEKLCAHFFHTGTPSATGLPGHHTFMRPSDSLHEKVAAYAFSRRKEMLLQCLVCVTDSDTCIRQLQDNSCNIAITCKRRLLTADWWLMELLFAFDA